MTEYQDFIEKKSQLGGDHGFEPVDIPGWLFDFQSALVEWALRKGRAAIFADCGLGKTAMELVWSDNIVKKTGGRVLLLTPLAVTHQIAADALKFGIEAKISRNGVPHAGITITNYEKLHLFDATHFVGVACDESSILKSYSGATRGAITTFARKLPYRLLATATAAPNDFTELGTSSEALGYLGHMDMLNRFFKNDLNNSASGRFAGEVIKWRLKGHAELPFWRWVCSWARAVRRPSDLGFDDARFVLPPLREIEHVVEIDTCAEGMLFALPAVGLVEQREERRRTMGERCERVFDLVNSHTDASMIWCHLNDEGDTLERMIPNSVQVSGKDTDECKELAARWFTGELCICAEPLFAAKLARWTKQTNGASTCANGSSTTKSTLQSTVEEQQISATRDAGNDTQMTRKSALENLMRSGHTESVTQTLDTSSRSPSTGSPLSNTTTLARPDAQSAEATQIQTAGELPGFTPTIATRREHSGGSCAQAAISGLENSRMTQDCSPKLRCICGHESGLRRLISKPVMFGWGLNFQHCNHITFFPSHSFEQYYQGVRRCWRFGQERPVTVDIVTTEGERGVLRNLQRKAEQADKMFSNLVAQMNAAQAIDRASQFTKTQEIPQWLTTI